ncbi:shikimate kinase [Aquabacter sediminis]|uniref:shikimate kinase n=1 Tax=Aquabacter sediminis TaxID=3029197 RepID=UPI00237DF196|nr:shikimate kinase [Aquabacter sp. P-9]MDE1569936.1 shikimate kinase [Aquabacter sp. P-9]
MTGPTATEKPDAAAEALLARLGRRCIVLVGMPGAGKSSVGRRLGKRLNLPFLDADEEIVRAAGMSIPEIFAQRGEAEFREGEKRVLSRLLQNGPTVVATGGGAYMNAETRANISRHGIAVWLHADHATLLRRVKKRTDRPLLAQGDAGERLAALQAEREPVYALADVTVESRDVVHEAVVEDVITALLRHTQSTAPTGDASAS